MRNQHKSCISLAIPILCLCLGSLVLLPFHQVGVFETEMYGINCDGCDPFDNTETEDDFLVSISIAAFAEQLLLKFMQMNLDFRSASLSPLFPPPKYS
jgi:hypothetical protein